MGGDALAVEQPGRGEKERAAAHRAVAAGFGSGTDRKCVTDKDGGKAVGMASCRSLSQSTLPTS